MVILTERRIEAVKLDLKGLSKTSATSLEVTVSITNSLVENLIRILKEENPTASEIEIIKKTRKILLYS